MCQIVIKRYLFLFEPEIDLIKKKGVIPKIPKRVGNH